jgi:hypothetical protein
MGLTSSISHERLLTPLEEAEKAIAVLRESIVALSDLAGLPRPAWVADDQDRGWQGSQPGFGGFAHAYVVRASTREDDPAAVRITYVLRGNEHLNEIAPSGTPHGPLLDRLASSLNIPVDAIRAYRGTELLEERSMNMRV